MSRLTGSEARDLMEAYNAVYAPQELTEEQIWEQVENWVNSLLEEGYDLSEYTWEEMYEAYILEALPTDYKRQELIAAQNARLSQAGTPRQGSAGPGAAPGNTLASRQPAPITPAAAKPAPIGQTVAAAGGKGGSVTVGRQYAAELGGVKGNVTYDASGKKTFTPNTAATPPKPVGTPAPGGTPPAPAAGTPAAPPRQSLAAQAAELRDMQKASQMRQQGANVMGSNITSVRQSLDAARARDNAPAPAGTALAAQQQQQAIQKLKNNPSPNLKMSLDLFDIVKGHLLDEGYADNEDAALVIMANMSEEWKQSIIESPGEFFRGIFNPNNSAASKFQRTSPFNRPTAPLPPYKSPFAKPASYDDSGKLTPYGAGGGAAAEKKGKSREQVIRQGAINIENKNKSKPVNQGPDFGR